MARGGIDGESPVAGRGLGFFLIGSKAGDKTRAEQTGEGAGALQPSRPGLCLVRNR